MNELATKSRQDTMIYTKSHGKGSHKLKLSTCFMADWECDPYVCRNCYSSCNDGTTSTPRDDKYECMYTMFLHKQEQRKFCYEPDESIIRGSKAWTNNKIANEESSTSRG
ncbi:hypothetical protein M9H77_23044 [Catharanthus roseus]|uniref:Uncharacterized protein n=1 Tax=Catharanthus roseus TaxID=4058 RepID=A0ACC0AW72_CATRO|nr:hypothetical protein M9H77_23044 [Catharanthus roseus]